MAELTANSPTEQTNSPDEDINLDAEMKTTAGAIIRQLQNASVNVPANAVPNAEGIIILNIQQLVAKVLNGVLVNILKSL